MLIRLGYDMHFELFAPVSFVAMLHVHPSRAQDLREPDILQVDPALSLDSYIDSFGNICTRFDAPAGPLRLSGRTLIEDSGKYDAIDAEAVEHPIQELPSDVLKYLLNSRYCEVDRLSNVALDLFGHLAPGWSRVQAIADWVHNR